MSLETEDTALDAEYAAAWLEADESDQPASPETPPETEAESPPEPAADEPAEEPEEAQGEVDESPAVDYEALYKKEVAYRKTWEGRIEAAKAYQQQLQQQQRPAPAAPPAQAPVDEDDAFLQKFRTEYNDDVVRAIDVISKRRASELVSQALASRVNPVENHVQDVLQQMHFTSIEAVHPDLYEINDDPTFEAWIASKPVHVRGAYQQVREHGTPAEVISMLNEYKETVKPKAPVPAARKAAPATAVQSRRGALPVASSTPPDPNDFHAAWMEAPD